LGGVTPPLVDFYGGCHGGRDARPTGNLHGKACGYLGNGNEMLKANS